MKTQIIVMLSVVITLSSCKEKQAGIAADHTIAQNNQKTETQKQETSKTPFIWEAANLYFMMTDRFNNGDTANDVNFDRSKKPAVLRGYHGGDLKGVTQKINEGYFTDLGINAIWMTPVVEQVHGAVDEGTGVTYGFHGYWTKDWTKLDSNVGTDEDLKALVEAAHKKGIRVVLDAVINHTGPVTKKDPVWPKGWVRENPHCTFDSYKGTIECTLVKNLPDVKTENNSDVALPPQLAEKWKKEGRYEQEMKELDAFFARTGYPRAPRFYIIKWLTDYITDYGIDGYRCDTVKHTEETVWKEFETECNYAFKEWKEKNPENVLDNNNFYLAAEVYNYNVHNPRAFDFGDKKVDYFQYGFDGMINFDFKYDAQKSYEEIFTKYSNLMNGPVKGYGVLNYISSHDDGSPFDQMRTKTKESATKLLLSPGISQVYYGDESARILKKEGAEGDANLRSFMNWDALKSDAEIQKLHRHWQKLGQFRVKHPAIGAGVHQKLSEAPYTFERTYTKGDYTDSVVVGLDLPSGEKELSIASVFKDGTKVVDAYSGKEAVVANGKVVLNTQFDIVLLETL